MKVEIRMKPMSLSLKLMIGIGKIINVFLKISFAKMSHLYKSYNMISLKEILGISIQTAGMKILCFLQR